MGWEEAALAAVVVLVVAARWVVRANVRRARREQGDDRPSGWQRWAILGAGLAVGMAFAWVKATT